MNDRKTLLIFDGHAILHRAWHALPPLATKKGLIVSGAYGFVMTLLRAIREFHPTHVAVTFDLKEPTFRHEAYDEYKAGREKQPEEFYQQIPIVEEILRQMNVPVFTAKGFEADDVIGTIAERAKVEDANIETVIVTGDLDTLQLVDERTRVFTMRQGFSDTVTYDPEAVRERYGLRPDQMVDYKALRGDPSDNIPGVKGVGEKTATELIGRFGSLAGLYTSIDANDLRAQSLKPAVKEKLLAGRASALQALDLCRIRRDAPIDFALDRTVYRAVSRSQMAPVFEEYQFNQLIQRLPEEPASSTKDAVAPAQSPAPTAEPKTEKKKAADKPPRDVKEKTKKPAAPKTPVPEQQLALGTASAAPPAESAPVSYKIVDTDEKLDALLVRLAKHRRIGFRSVVVAEDPVLPQVVALGLCCGRRVHFVEAAVVRANAAKITRWLAVPSRLKICHDLKNEINALYALGVGLDGHIFDLMLASYLYFSGERRHSLGALLSFYRNLQPPIGAPSGDLERLRRAADELPHFLPLAEEFGRNLRKYKLVDLYEDMELPVAHVLAKMERDGIAVDVPYLHKLSGRFGARIEELEKDIYKQAGTEFNVNSPRQIKEILFERLKLSTTGLKKTTKGKEISTAAGELEKLRGSHPIIEKILAYRELAKLKSTYVDALPELVQPRTGRIHASFNQAVTATGRLSSSNPNLQNIPTADSENGQAVRDAFVAPAGRRLVAFDYSQIELRIAAHIAKEKVMIKSFKAGEDIHWRTAAAMWGEAEADAKRRFAKTINFGILFGMGPMRLAESAGIPLAEAREYIDRYFAVYSGIAAYMETTKEKLKRDGYVETLFGRRRFFFNYDAMNHREQAEVERQAINMPIQGTEADLIKLAMIRLDKWIVATYGEKPDAPVRLLLQVHDELVLEVESKLVKEVIAGVLPIMESVKKLAVPIVVDVKVGERWGVMEKVRR